MTTSRVTTRRSTTVSAPVSCWRRTPPECAPLPERAISVDVFVGEPDLIGKGHGGRLLRAFLPLAFDRYGLDYCVIGPSKANVAAIRAYEKAGFRWLKEYREPDTTDPDHVLLDIRRGEL